MQATMSDKPASRIMTGAEFLVHALVSAKVTHVFGGHGGSVVPLIDEIERHPSITWVYCRCEVNASQAAAAYAKLHGRLGCCVATSGPGAAHLLSGIVDADQDRVPLLCITGMKDSGHIGYADFQDINQASIFRMAGVAFSESVTDIHQLLPLTRNAFTLAIASNRTAHLSVPVNVQQEELKARTHFCLGTAYQQKVAAPATRLQIDTLAMALRAEIESGRHVLIACGWRAHKVGAEIERIAELLRAPIITSFDGKGAVNERHRLAFGVVGVYGNAGTPASVSLLEDCDTVISVCVTDHTELVASKSGLQVRRLIQIEERLLAGDALRFSPSTLFSSGHLKESLKMVGKELERGLAMNEKYLRRLTVGVNHEDVETHQPQTGMDIWDKLKTNEGKKPTGTPSTFLAGDAYRDSKHITSSDFCHPAVFFDMLGDKLQDDAVVCADIGDNALWMASSLAAKRGQRFITSEHMGIMGFGLNAGMAVSISSAATGAGDGHKPRQTLVVAGDGGFQMSLNELATLRDHGATNVLVVVIVNSRLGRVQNETWGPRLKADGCSIGSPDFVKLFEAYGYPNGMKLATSDKDAIARTIDSGWSSAEEHGLCVIELMQDPLVHPVMHKLSAHDKMRRSLLNWEDKSRNLRSKALFPEIATHHWHDHNQALQSWLDTLTQVEVSEKFWFHTEDFIYTSPSKAVQNLLDSLKQSLPQNEVPTLFTSLEARETFDSHFKSSFLNSFPAEVCESVLLDGTSNNYPLCLQLLACPKKFSFPLHAHPNVELDIPLIGELWERRALSAYLPDTVLKREPARKTEAGHAEKPSEEELKRLNDDLKRRIVFEDQGEKGAFVDRVAAQGQVLYNEIGSTHQSYTKEHGCLILALWSGVHANIAPGNFRQQTGVEDLVLGEVPFEGEPTPS